MFKKCLIHCFKLVLAMFKTFCCGYVRNV